MPKYCVCIPVVGQMVIFVEADTRTDAKAVAWEKFGDEGEGAGDLEWECVEEVTRGNVCNAPLTQVSVEEE
jgi:hypothetical protein